MLARLSKNRVAALTRATLRSTSFQRKCSPFPECNGARTSHVAPEKNSNSRAEPNFEKNPILHADPNSKHKCNLRARPSLDEILYVRAEPTSGEHPNLRAEPTSEDPNLCAELSCKESPNGHTESKNGEFSNSHEDPGTSKSRASEIITLWGSYRVRGGELQELRKNGMIPGIVSDYDAERGTNYNYYIALQRKEVWGHLTRMGRKDFMSRFYNLALRDQPDSDQIEHTVKVYPSKLYLIDGRRSILNLAFVRVRRNVKLRMMIPLKFRGRTVCPGLIKGGTLVVLKKALSLFVFPDEVPPYIEVDVSKLNIGERILVNDLDLDLQYSRQAGHVVCEVKKYQFVRPNRSRSLARSSADIGPPKYSW